MDLFLAIGIVLMLAGPALAAPPSCSRCKDLPKLEKELFQQEWLQHEFHEYALGNKWPSGGAPGDTAKAMRDQVLADFNAWLGTAAGGGSKGNGHAALGTNWGDCTLVTYVTDKTTAPFDEKKFREKTCKEEADFLLAHENRHIEQCKKSGSEISYYMDYAAQDTQAYGTGIRNLRTSIADLAKKCGWQGSTSSTKNNPDDRQKEDVVPTKKEADDIARRMKR